MVLSDRTIRRELDEGRIVVDPIDFDDIQPASIDLHLDNRFLVFSNSRRPYIDVRESQADLTEEVKIQGDDQFILHPGEFVLGSTLEHIELPTISSRALRARAAWDASDCSFTAPRVSSIPVGAAV